MKQEHDYSGALEAFERVLDDYNHGITGNRTVQDNERDIERVRAALTAAKGERMIEEECLFYKVALTKIAAGEGVYGAQAGEYKKIAKAALEDAKQQDYGWLEKQLKNAENNYNAWPDSMKKSSQSYRYEQSKPPHDWRG